MYIVSTCPGLNYWPLQLCWTLWQRLLAVPPKVSISSSLVQRHVPVPFYLGKTTGLIVTSGVRVKATYPFGTTVVKEQVCLLRWRGGKESAWQFRRHKRRWFDPWVGKIPWRRKWQPTPVFLPGEFYGQRNLAGCSPWGLKELDMT